MTLTERTLKIVSATFISILIANLLNLDYPMAAGIIAILSVLNTRRESIFTAFYRIVSTLVAFLTATSVFYILGFTLPAFSVYLLIYVPVAYHFNLHSGIAPASVLVTHFIIAESTAIHWQVNGLLLMSIGAVVAVGFNLWMPSYEGQLTLKVNEIEEEMRRFLNLFHQHLSGKRDERILINQSKQLYRLIAETEEKALMDYDNQLTNKTDYYIKYAQMRKQQVDLLTAMIHDVSSIHLAIQQNKVLADLFKEIADQLDEKNTGVNLLADISFLYNYFRQSDLPKTRVEFENRAILFQILRDIERFIELKREFFLSKEDWKK